MAAYIKIITMFYAISLAACARVEVGTGFDEVSALVTERGGGHLAAIPQPDGLSVIKANESDAIKPIAALSLRQALQGALTNSPTLQAHYARLAISRADVLQASLLKNPTFNSDVVAGITGDPTRFALGAVYPILDIVYQKPRIKAAQADFKAIQLEVAAAVIEHANDVTKAYFDLAYAKARLGARQEIVNVARQQIDAIEKLVASGSLDGSDLAKLQTIRTKADIELDAARGERDGARIRLAGLIGAPLESPIDTTMPFEKIDADNEKITDLTAEAYRQRVDILRAEQEVAIRKQALERARRIFDPDGQEIGLNLEHEEGERFLGPSFSVEVPIFDRGRYRRAKAMAELVEAERRLVALRQSVDTQVRAAYQQVRSRRQAALAYQNKLVPSARSFAVLARERFKVGAIEAAEFLAAQLAISEAKLETLNAQAQYLEARLALAKTIGGWPSTF